MKDKKIRITVSIPKKVDDGLITKMEETGRTKSNLVTHLLKIALGNVIKE